MSYHQNELSLVFLEQQRIDGMFHTGDLQSGISRAIQEQKLVVCFVRQGQDHHYKDSNTFRLTFSRRR